ncbi:uncharacterized protein K02A2.6-like [Ochlerotatus camptorhynchus]|uniref:uncharacterized protein K02A2.6-like n=1 Tax=Ochlerotatus camptorhynchus TaxID=644619 RepID=UPI0031DFDA2E
MVVTDNGTQFTAEKFQSFLKANGIKHCLTAPGHPATNGVAENFVKTFKASLKKALLENRTKNYYEISSNFLIAYRRAAHCSSKVSPAVAMLGRELVINFDRLIPRKKQACTVDVLKHNLLQAQSKQREYHKGKRMQELREFRSFSLEIKCSSETTPILTERDG